MDITAHDFLNPGSMLTPGLAGSFAMGLTNLLSGQLGMVAPEPACIGLVLSFMFGLPVLAVDEVGLLKRCAFYLFDSLVIFTVALGLNTAGQAAMASAQEPTVRPVAVTPAITQGSSPDRSLTELLISAATAQSTPAWCCAGGKVSETTASICNRGGGQLHANAEAAQRACEGKRPPPGFFRAWIR